MPQNPPEGYHKLTPQSITPQPEETIVFAESVFDAQIHDRYEVDGAIVHAEFEIGDSRMMVGASGNEYPPLPSAIHVYVDDVDATYQRALEHGATRRQEPVDQFYGDRSAVVFDSQGNLWSIATHIEDVSPEEMHRRMDELSG